MSDSKQLPVPDTDALDHSARVSEFIRQRIVSAGGWIDFSEYMNQVLYAPGLGYYSAGAHKFGAAGDFVTAPEISDLFPGCVARSFLDMTLASQSATGTRPASPETILELGAGTGAMAAGILGTLQQHDALPERYLILEVSADLRDRQRRLIHDRIPALAERVEWLDTLPEQPIKGVIVANEVLDALPVSRFVVEANNHLQVLGVEAGESDFSWSQRAASEEMHAEIQQINASMGVQWPEGYTSEFVPSLPGFIASLSNSLESGLILFIDYGLPERAYYDPGRCRGTLACHFRHHRHEDPFLYPGLQDITAWVDFTRLAEAATAAQLDVLGYTTQAQFLIAAGIEQDFAERMAEFSADQQEQIRLSAGLRTLLMPGEMGESFKVMALGRNVADGPGPVCANDLLHLL